MNFMPLLPLSARREVSSNICLSVYWQASPSILLNMVDLSYSSESSFGGMRFFYMVYILKTIVKRWFNFDGLNDIRFI